MNYFFDTTSLTSRDIPTFVTKIKTALRSETIKTATQYNAMIKTIAAIAKEQKFPQKRSQLHTVELAAISAHRPLTEPTAWGGVTLKKVDVAKDFIQKLLVINQWGVLGFEIHVQKLEKLRIIEGTCLVFYSNHAAKDYTTGRITVQLAKKGDRFTFLPKDEHGILALTDTIIEETSTNHLDDLVYIYPAAQLS